MDNEFVADSDEDQQLDLATWPPSVKHKDDASLLAKQSDTNCKEYLHLCVAAFDILY
jgi:hypothetical protein